MNNVFSGLAAALPLSAMGAVYALIRFEPLADLFREGDAEMAAVGEGPIHLMLMAMFGLGPILFGGIAGLVYGAISSRQAYLALALGLAVLMTIWAFLSRTPMMTDKIIMNFAVALILGLLVPHLAGA